MLPCPALNMLQDTGAIETKYQKKETSTDYIDILLAQTILISFGVN